MTCQLQMPMDFARHGLGDTQERERKHFKVECIAGCQGPDAQGSGGVPVPGGIQTLCGCGTWGHGLAGMGVLA